MKAYYRFKKRFYGLLDKPTKLQEKIERTLNYETAVLFDDVKIVTRDKDKHREKLFKSLKQL